jgi:hypothetical protein
MTKTDICNLALSKIGSEGGLITAGAFTNPTTDKSKEAVLCAQFYDQTLGEVLSIGVWNCAKARAALVADETAPLFGWRTSFAIPADCTRPLAFFSSKTQREDTVDWVVEGAKILSNSDEGYLLYVKTLAEAAMPRIFISVLVQALAIKLCYPLTQDMNIQKVLIQEMQEIVLPEARRVNAFEGYRRPIIQSDWMDATVSSGEMYRALDVTPVPFNF